MKPTIPSPIQPSADGAAETIVKQANQAVRRFAANARRERRARDLSQEQLAELAGLHRNSVGKFERGETSISLGAAAQLALALGIDLKDLL